MEELQLIWPLLTVAASGGGALVALNGTRQRVKDIAQKLDEHIDEEHDRDMNFAKEISSMAAKQDMLIDYLKEQKQ